MPSREYIFRYSPPNKWLPSGGRFYRNAMRSYYAYAKNHRGMKRKVEAAIRGRAKFKSGMNKLMAAIRFKKRNPGRATAWANFARRERAYVRARRRGHII